MEEAFITLNELLAKYGSAHLPYSRLLETAEWHKRRDEIIDRDKCQCVKCKVGDTESLWPDSGHLYIYTDAYGNGAAKVLDKPYHLEVHHKFYIHNRYPWQYPDDALMTLCNWCHQELHQHTIVPYYSDKGNALGYTPCARCNGVGRLPEFSHVQSGVCFQCSGARYEELISG